jgi:solute carrier family 35 protein F1/2
MATIEDVEKSSPTDEINTLPRTTVTAVATERSIRPPIDYSSALAFRKSFVARWKSIWTKNFILALIAGQVLSICITCTSVTTTELVHRGWTLSTTQGFFL